MKEDIAGFLYKRTEHLLEQLGLSQHTTESYGTVITSGIAIILAFAVAEISYRIILFVVQRIVHHKEYAFLS